MFHFFRIACLFTSLCCLGSRLDAVENGGMGASRLETNEDGLPIIEVTLHARKRPEKKMKCRFLLSTGTEKTIIDESIPLDYYINDPLGTGGHAAATSAYTEILMKRMEVAGMIRDGIAAARMNLKASAGRCMDVPVDGILGMSFLRGTRFVFQPAEQQVLWGPGRFTGASLPVAYPHDQVPCITLRLGPNPVAVSLMLGSMGGLDLPWNMRPADAGKPIHHQGIVGTNAEGQRIEVESVAAGPYTWGKIPVSFMNMGACGAIGQDVWSAAPVCFDFVRDQVTFQLDSKQKLPIQADARLSVPVLWDRTGTSSRLIIEEVPPDTPMETAGCQPGDVILQAGGMSGAYLTRRKLMELLAGEQPHTWMVWRAGKTERLSFFPVAEVPAEKPVIRASTVRPFS